MTDQEAIDQLDGLIRTADSESAHLEGDYILLSVLKETGHLGVAEAYENVRERVEFWYS